MGSPRRAPSIRNWNASVVLPAPGIPSIRYRRLPTQPPERMSSSPSMPVVTRGEGAFIRKEVGEGGGFRTGEAESLPVAPHSTEAVRMHRIVTESLQGHCYRDDQWIARITHPVAVRERTISSTPAASIARFL